MTTDDLIEKLKEMRAAARRGDNMTAMTQLFGIIFDKDIETSGSNAVAIGRRAGIGVRRSPMAASWLCDREAGSAPPVPSSSTERRLRIISRRSNSTLDDGGLSQAIGSANSAGTRIS